MFILCDNMSNIVYEYDNTIISNIQPNCVFLPKTQFRYDLEVFKVYEIESLPSDYTPTKYCYTIEKGFYENPDWEETKPVILITDEQKDLVVDEINGGVENGIN